VKAILDFRFWILDWPSHRRGAHRLVLLLLAVAILAALPSAEAQQPGKLHQIGFLRYTSPQASSFEAFRQGLRALGYAEGQNIAIEQRYAHGVHDRLPDLAAELVRLKVDVIVVDGTATAIVAKAATTTIPIVFTLAGDPVGSGLVASLARPGGNVTGLSNLAAELSGKQLQLLKEAVPGASQIAILYNPVNPAMAPALDGARAAARALAVQLQVLEVRRPNELGSAFSAMARGRAGALLTLPDAIFATERVRLLEFAAKSRLPVIFSQRQDVEAGGLMSYGPNFPDQFRRAASYVDKILKGAKPGDLPVEQPTKFELVINLKTAKALGLKIPQSILVRADEVIQ
jgi:putative ABC transport system substrate-binding protein